MPCILPNDPRGSLAFTSDLLISSPGPSEAVCAAAAEAAATAPAPPQQRDQIATIVGAGRARRGVSAGGDSDGGINDPMEETDAADFANYFYSYAELDHQKQMLEDERCSIPKSDREYTKH